MLIPFSAPPAQPMCCRCTPGLAVLLLPGLIQRPDRQAAAAPGPARRLIQPRDREPAHRAHRRGLVPARAVQQPLRSVRRPVTDQLRDRPPVAPRQVAHHRRGIAGRLQPRLGSREPSAARDVLEAYRGRRPGLGDRAAARRSADPAQRLSQQGLLSVVRPAKGHCQDENVLRCSTGCARCSRGPARGTLAPCGETWKVRVTLHAATVRPGASRAGRGRPNSGC